MRKITLKSLVAGLSVVLLGCSGAGPSSSSENARSTSQPLTVTAPGWITAFAGSGVRGSSPTGTAALSAMLDSPSGLALCPDGALYVSDTGNNRIVKFSGGVMTVVVAGQTTASGKPYGNLIANPRAESQMVAGQIPGWAAISPNNGWSEVPWAPTRPEPLDGEMYFRANPGPSGELYQDVDVSAYSAEISAGTQKFAFSGFVHSLSGDANPDASQIVLEYRDGRTGGTLLSTYDSGQQQNRGEWKLLTDTRTAPINTRSIRVRLISTRHTGSGNDAYYDGLFLRALPPTNLGDPHLAVLASPHGLACDSQGTLYIADTYNNRIVVVRPDGYKTFAGNGFLGYFGDGLNAIEAELALPMSVTVSGSNDFTLFIADFLNHRIRAVMPGVGTQPGLMQTVAGFALSYPMGVVAAPAFQGASEVFVADRSDNAVWFSDVYSTPVNPSGFPPPAEGFPHALTSGPGFSDALTPFTTQQPQSFGQTYRPVAIATSQLSPDPSPSFPAITSATIYPNRWFSSAFVGDLSNHAIRHLTVDGVMQTVAGNGTPGDSGDGGPAYQALLTAPAAIVQSRDGTIYVADAETNRIRAIYCADVDQCHWSGTFDPVARSCTWTARTPPPINDGNVCTFDQCFWTTGHAEHIAIPNNSQTCLDDNPCNGSETCIGTVCTAGTPLATGASCDDGNLCNGSETCDANHVCQPGALPLIADTNPCTTDVCTASGGVTHPAVVNGTPCSVNDPCMNPGTCNNGMCSTTAIVLNPPKCFSETCSSPAGVVRTPLTGATTGGTCNAGVFVPTGAASFTLPAVDNTVPPTSGSLFASIYAPGSTIQTGVAAGTINPDHAAHLFGVVFDGSSATPLAGASVTIVNHPELGQTLTRSDGKYDIVVNGGGPVVLRFTKALRLPVDRQASPIWGGGAHIDDVVMIPVDAAATAVAVNSASFLDAAGTTTNVSMDARGQRQARVVFPPATTATAVDLLGASTPLTAMTVRATEFTVGTSTQALARMPAPLPGSSLYTYAVDFSVDQAPNAASVVFNQPVFGYVDNFLKMPAGATVPDGYYDRNKTAWVPEHNGLVIAIVGYSAGSAIVDVTGDGVENASDTAAWSAFPANERITAGERTLLATRYPGATSTAPKSLWRMPLTHFSMHDFNWGGGPDCDNSTPPKCPGFNGVISGGADAPQAGSCDKQGSIIGVEEQSLGESLPVMGTPYTLEYRSSYTLGYLPAHGAEVDFPPLPGWLTPIRYEVRMDTPGGSSKFISDTISTHYITWDGLDSAGRRVNGSQLATFGATSVYKANYRTTGHFGDSAESDTISGALTTDPAIAPEVRFSRKFTKVLSAWGSDTLGLGGWTLSPMHVYDTTAGVLYQGDGTRRNLHNELTVRLIDGTGITASDTPSLAVAGNGDIYFASVGASGTSILRKIDALTRAVTDVLDLGRDSSNNAYLPGRMAFGPTGQYLYIPARKRILRVDVLAKAQQVFAGTGVGSNLDGPAAQATFNDAAAVATAFDGTLYVTDGKVVRKIATDDAHTVSTVAGAASAPYRCDSTDPSLNADGKPAKGVQLALWGLTATAPAVAADGSLWIGTGLDLIRVDPQGLAHCFKPTQPIFGGIAIGSDQSVYFAVDDQGGTGPNKFSIRQLMPDGTTATVAGGLGCGQPSDGARAASSSACRVRAMATGPDGSIYFVNTTDNVSASIFQLAMPVTTGPATCPIALPSEDGAQTFCFDTNGRHLTTRNTLTGDTVLTFTYSNNLLSQIQDLDGNKTTITQGNPVVITGPFGQTTKIGLNAAKYATYIQDATQKQTLVTHDANGLLLSMTDRNSKQHTFSYDELGRLKRDADPANGYQILNRSTVSTGGYLVSDASALGATSSYAVNVDSQGIETRTVTSPDNTTNQSTLSLSGASTTTLADGTTLAESTVPDALWPSYQPYVSSSTTTLPSGLSRQISASKTVSYQTGTSPPAIDTVNEQFTDSGLVGTPQPKLIRSFKNSTKTYTITSFGGRVSNVSVDSLGRPVTITPPGVDAVTYHYDLGRLSSVTQGTRQTSMAFYPLTDPTAPGRLKSVTVTDPAGNINTILAPDNAGRALKSTTSYVTGSTAPRETDFSWDSEGNMSTLTPPSLVAPPGKPVHAETYTPVNLLQSYLPPAVPDVPDSTTTFFYNVDRSLEYVRQPGGRGVDYVYNTASGQLVQIAAGGATDATFGYYSVSNSTGAANGRLQTASRGATTVTLKYDGPLTTSQAWSGTGFGAVNGSAAWAYDADFRLQSETVSPAPTPAGLGTASYLYDADELVTCASLSTSLSTCTPSTSTMTLAYSPTSGALTSTSLGKITEAYTPNEYGELATYSAKGTSVLCSYTDDAAAPNSRDGFGRIKHELELGVAFGVRDYGYDEQGRLWKVTLNGVLARQYGYDANGNRLSIDPSGTVIASYDNQDRMLTYNAVSYGYGPNGERRKRTNVDASVDEYQYDAVGNLSHITRADGVAIDYVVDAFNRRIAKNKNGSTYAQYLYRNGLSPVAVLTSTGALAARFVYVTRRNTPDFMVLADGTVFKFINDLRGSPHLIVNAATGVIAQRIDYDEFGIQTLVTDAGAFPRWAQPFGFAGGLYDEDTGLVRFGARDYEAATGRWLAKDPILFGGGQANLYVYAGNDPVNRRDPQGLFGFAFGASGGAGFGFPLGGSYDYARGYIVDFTFSDGLTIGKYTSHIGSVGVGGYLGAGVDFTVNFGSVKDFAGASLGGKFDIGAVERADVRFAGALGGVISKVCGGLGGVSGSAAGSFTVSDGFGGGLYAGAAASFTHVDGYNFRSHAPVSY